MITILALPGNGGGAYRFEQIRPFLPPTLHFQAITLPGFAGKPIDPSLQTLADYAHHVYSIAQTLPRPLVLLGSGIGGSIALEFAQQYAHSIQGLILHAPVGARLQTRLFPKLMAKRPIRELGKQILSAKIFRPFFTRRLFQNPPPPAILNRFFDDYRHTSTFSQMFDLITAEWFASLQPIQLPAALLWGEKERVLNPQQLHDYKTLLPHHIIHTVPHWDHFPMLEHPAEFAQVIAQLASHLVN